jgi:hypothetical protein
MSCIRSSGIGITLDIFSADAFYLKNFLFRSVKFKYIKKKNERVNEKEKKQVNT